MSQLETPSSSLTLTLYAHAHARAIPHVHTSTRPHATFYENANLSCTHSAHPCHLQHAAFITFCTTPPLSLLGLLLAELVNPAASTQAAFDCTTIANMGLRAKVLTHTRCHMHDVTKAIECGVDGVNLYMATSSVLSQHSHGKGIDAVIEIAAEVIEFVKSHGVEVRFSCTFSTAC